MAKQVEPQHTEVIEGEVVDGGLVKVEPSWPAEEGEHALTELLSQSAGSMSPFGDDVSFPLPAHAINYQHPTALPNR